MYFTIFWVNDSEKSKGGTLWCKRAPIESKNKDQGFCEMQLLRLFYIKGSPLWYKRASIALKTWIKDFINCIYCGSFTSKGPPFGFFKIIDVLWKKSLNRFKFTKLNPGPLCGDWRKFDWSVTGLDGHLDRETCLLKYHFRFD